MTFLDYLAAQGDANCRALHSDLSGLADGANDIAAVVAYLRATIPPCELPYASEEARYRWKEWQRTVSGMEKVGLSRESSPDLLT